MFAQLWDTVFAEVTSSDLSTRDLLWYLAVTEWIVLSFPYVHTLIEMDARTGELAARLPQPVSYVAARFAEGAGGSAVRLVVVGVAAGLLTTALAGGLPREPFALLLVVPLAIIATAFGLLSVVGIGLSAIWLHDSAPLFWIWQKLAFILGGLILPLEIYPDLFRRIAIWTPFGAMLNGPGRQMLSPDLGDALLVAGQLAVWTGLLAAVVGLVWRPALRSLNAHGG